MEQDDRAKSPIIRFPKIDDGLQGWYDMKRRLNEQSGIQFGFDYNSLYQSADEAQTDDSSAWSGVFRVLGTWELFNKGETDVGTLILVSKAATISVPASRRRNWPGNLDT